MTNGLSSKLFNSTVILTGLGYLVDVYDMWSFNVTRVAVLGEFGITGEAAVDAGLFVINMQLIGVVLGGLIFGVMGDRLGRKSCLLGSILLYSLATLGCAFAQNLEQMAVLRFIAGLGLAGELGIGVSLITESMTRKKRGLGTVILVFFGIVGAILAGFAATVLEWRMVFMVGGVAGLALLFLRSAVMESGMFAKIKHAGIDRGNVLKILKSRRHLLTFLGCVCLGMPMFFVAGQIWTFGPEIAKSLGISGVTAAKAFFIGNVTMLAGDLLVGGLSQKLRSRKLPVHLLLISMSVVFLVMILMPLHSATAYYVFCGLLGVTTGYWVNLITMSAELFGTNLRATAATAIPAFIRLNIVWQNLAVAALKGSVGYLSAIALICAASLGLAFVALRYLEETYGKDLDYHD